MLYKLQANSGKTSYLIEMFHQKKAFNNVEEISSMTIREKNASISQVTRHKNVNKLKKLC